MSNNIRMIINNEHDEATLTATSEAMPVAYTQRSGRSYVWRSTDTADQTITASFTTPTYVSGVVVYNHNLTASGVVRVEYLLDGQVVYDSGDVIAANIIPIGTWRAGIDPWGAEDLTELPTVQYNIWTSATLVDGYRITIKDPANPDGYLQVSRIFAGVSYSPQLNPKYGLSLEWQDLSANQRTESGSLRTVGEGTARRLTFDLSYLDNAELTRLSREMLRSGKGQDLYVSVYPGAGGMMEAEHAFVARRASDYAHGHTFYRNWESSLELQEV